MKARLQVARYSIGVTMFVWISSAASAPVVDAHVVDQFVEVLARHVIAADHQRAA
jgi:hypothetical protein